MWNWRNAFTGTRDRLGWFESHGDLLFDLVRIYLGLALFAKGIWFIGHQSHLIGLIDGSGTYWIVPAMVAHLVILVHLTGGALVALGIGTRIGAAIQIPALLGAVFRIHLPALAVVEQRQSFELSALVLFLLLLVLLRGNGPLALENRMHPRRAAAKAVAAH